MVQPFGSTYEDETINTQPNATATAPPMEAVDHQYVDFILLGDRENYAVRAEKRAIAESHCELSRIFQSSGTTAVRRVDDNRFSVSESNKENFELFIRYDIVQKFR